MGETGSEGIYGRNPFRAFFAPKGHISIVRFIAILLAVNTLAVIVTWFDGTLRSWDGNVGLLDDAFHLLLLAVLILIFWLVQRVVSHTIEFLEFVPNMLSAGVNRDALHAISTRGIASITLAADAKTARLFYWGIIGFFSVLATYFSALLPLTGDAVSAWALMPYEKPISFGFGLFWAIYVWPIVLGNFACYLLLCGFFVVRTIWRLDSEGEISLSPVSRDGMGGLSVVGDIMLVAVLICTALAIGTLAWIQQFGSDETIRLAVIIYLPVVALIFGGPLIYFMRAISRSKKRQLDHLTRIIQANFPTLRDQTLMQLSEREITDDSEVDKLKLYSSLVNLYRRFEDLSVWPVRPVTAVLTLIAYVTPVAQFLLSSTDFDSQILQFLTSIGN